MSEANAGCLLFFRVGQGGVLEKQEAAAEEAVSAQCIPSLLKNRITEHYSDSQVIVQQKLHIRICCTLSINIVDACFDHRYSTTVLQTNV